jgi:alpha-tubulin suppressor-like RCC1 family protein
MKNIIKVQLLLCFFSLLNQNTFAQCWQVVTGGELHSVAIKTDGTLWAWGDNTEAQLGDGTTVAKNTPKLIDAATNWLSIAAGGYHTLALKNNGTLWAWGKNMQGQLGDGTNTVKNTPTQIGSNMNWQSIAAGDNFSLALKSNGEIWVWGDNFEMQHGNGLTTNTNTPTLIGLDTDWSQIAAGDEHCLALKDDGTLWSWGKFGAGQLGLGLSGGFGGFPMQVGLESNWVKIEAGDEFSIAKKTNGSIWASGLNFAGQLGDGTIINKNTFTQIGSSFDWINITTGGSHCLATKSNGTLWAWGNNAYGQLGDGNTMDKNIPTQIGSATNWTKVSAGLVHSFAFKPTQLFSFGLNFYGQLGDGTTINKTVPTLISCLGVAPVKLISFTGQTKNHFNELQWTTSQEINSLHFEIERSEDAVNFMKIGIIQSSGNSSTIKNYVFSDANATLEKCYYRLKQVDIDGTFEYSNVISISNSMIKTINIFPNPSSNYINVIGAKNNTILRIYSAEGKLIIQQKIVTPNQKINIAQLKSGLYLCAYFVGNNILNTKFKKQ